MIKKSVMIYCLVVSFYSGCSDSDTNGQNILDPEASENQSDVKSSGSDIDVRSAVFVRSESFLPKCEKEILGKLFYLENEAIFRVCIFNAEKNDYVFDVIDLQGSPGKDGISCSAEKLENGIAVKCGNQDELIVSNGKMGSSGQDGKNGFSSYIETVSLQKGDDVCPSGGLKFVTYLDSNPVNRSYDPGEEYGEPSFMCKIGDAQNETAEDTASPAVDPRAVLTKSEILALETVTIHGNGDLLENSPKFAYRYTGPNGQPLNDKENPLFLRKGQTLSVCNEQSATNRLRLHTNGTPFPHGANIDPGECIDYFLSQTFESNGHNLYDHNLGRQNGTSAYPIYIVVLSEEDALSYSQSFKEIICAQKQKFTELQAEFGALCFEDKPSQLFDTLTENKGNQGLDDIELIMLQAEDINGVSHFFSASHVMIPDSLNNILSKKEGLASISFTDEQSNISLKLNKITDLFLDEADFLGGFEYSETQTFLAPIIGPIVSSNLMQAKFIDILEKKYVMLIISKKVGDPSNDGLLANTLILFEEISDDQSRAIIISNKQMENQGFHERVIEIQRSFLMGYIRSFWTVLSGISN